MVDHENTAGFGRDAVVAVMTQQQDGVQRQSLFYSTDDGHTFTAYGGNPVLDNPDHGDFRDPKIIRDEANKQWVMTLAEGEKIGIYTSRNLRDWTYASASPRPVWESSNARTCSSSIWTAILPTGPGY